MGKDRIKNAVLGKTVADRLFGANSDPIGQSIGINNVPFQVSQIVIAVTLT
jgi:hypothetical protein